MEVVVDFLEGDPTGRSSSVRCTTLTTCRPTSSPTTRPRAAARRAAQRAAGDSNFNELRFEDKKGSERVYFHAREGLQRVVENNDSLKVGYDKMSPGKQDIEIFGNRTTTIETGNDNLTLKVGSKTTTVMAGSITYTAMQSITLQCGASIISMTPASISLTSGAITLTASGAITQTAGGAFHGDGRRRHDADGGGRCHIDRGRTLHDPRTSADHRMIIMIGYGRPEWNHGDRPAEENRRQACPARFVPRSSCRQTRKSS
jgi:hypothetical protein